MRRLRIASKESKRGQTPLRDPPPALPSAGLFYCLLLSQLKSRPHRGGTGCSKLLAAVPGAMGSRCGANRSGGTFGRCNGVPTDLTHPLSVTSDSVSPQIQCRVRRRAHGSVETFGAGTGRQLVTGSAQVACRPLGRLRVDGIRLIAFCCHGNR